MFSFWSVPTFEQQNASWDGCRPVMRLTNIPCQSAVSCKLNFTHSNSRATNVSSIQFSSVPWPIWSSGEYEGLCQLWAKGRLWRETFGARSLVLPDALVRQHCAGSKTRTKELVLGRFDLKRRKFHDFSPVVELCQYWSVCERAVYVTIALMRFLTYLFKLF